MTTDTDRIHKAEPVQAFANDAHSTCIHCHREIKRVPGGNGPTWVHSDTGTVVGSGPASTKPTYEELASAFEEYIASTNNDGAGVAPEEEMVERAIAFFERTGVPGTYYRTHDDEPPPAVGLQLS